jgi:sugar-phosphatase
MSESAVLFDLDGTLVDSTESVARCWDRLAEAAGFDVTVLDELHGIPAKKFIETLLGPERRDELAHWTEWHLKNEVHDVGGTVAYPGALPLMQWIDSQPNLRWGIVTSCQRELAVARLTEVKLPIPEVFVTFDDVTKGKPNPEPYLLGAQLMNLPPANTFVIEDAPAGVTAGISAGATVLAVTTTHSHGVLRHASHIVDNLEGVLSHLQGLA